MGSQERIRRGSPGHQRSQAPKLNTESGKELPPSLDALLSSSKLQKDTVVVRDGKQYLVRCADGPPTSKPSLQVLQKRAPLNKLNSTNLTLNEDSQGTLQIPATLAREPGGVIDQLQT